MAQTDPDSYQRTAAIRRLASGWWDDGDVFPFLKQMVQSDEDEYIRRIAMEKLESGWHENPDIQKFLAILKAQSA